MELAILHDFRIVQDKPPYFKVEVITKLLGSSISRLISDNQK